LLERVCDNWPGGFVADYLIVCGGFVLADWPGKLNIRWVRDPTDEEQDEIHGAGKRCAAKLLSTKLVARLKKVCKFFSFGVDVYQGDGIVDPHAEMVCLIETATGKTHWTCKFLPVDKQKAKLVVPFGMESHFIRCGKDRVMILGCHDLWAFVKRGRKHSGETDKDRARKEIARLTRERRPTVVLQHPHTSDFVQTWSGSWGGLKRHVGDSLKAAASAGRHPRRTTRGDIVRTTDLLDRILAATRTGPTMDIVVRAK
ncbi:MAG: hypothetical protein Q8M92_01960, partial [Candidatus Subteraquimicrobiales bacterium]|nr:hypothetical protein [Candidatus Subteraquimicrobiales bacterium]